MRRVSIRAALVCACALLFASQTSAQADRFEKTIPFRIDESQPIGATLGPVQVTTLKVTNLGRGYGRGGIGLRAMEPSELSTTLRFAFDVNNPRDVDWEVTFTIELLDRDGKVIDRTTHKKGFEGEAKTYTVEHPILEYVLPDIAQVHLTLHARLD